MRIALFVAVAGAVAACGTTGGSKGAGPGAEPTSTSVSGNAGGQSFAVKEALGLYDTAREYSGVILTDFSGSCSVLGSGMRAPPSAQVLEILLVANGLGMAPGPGTYVFGMTPNVALAASYLATDPSCKITASEQATGGSVTLDTVDSTTVTGVFDVTFPNGDHWTGQFDAPVCSVDITNLGANAGGCVGADQ